jgi:hypothetical protein
VKEAPKKEEVVKKPLGYNITITYKK